MTEASDTSEYVKLVAAVMGRGTRITPSLETAGSVQVERGVVLPAKMRGSADDSVVDRLIELSNAESLGDIAVVDACGHRRPVYRPLMIYCWLLAHEMSPEPSWIPALRKWCKIIRPLIDGISATDVYRAADGAVIAEAVWAALAIRVAGEWLQDSEWIDAGTAVFRRLCARQLGNGAFLKATSRDNPETLWYHELILLQAAASYAARGNDAVALRSAEASAGFHLNETQPDHATAQPWGLLAFVQYAPLLADQILHTMTTQQPGGVDGISLMLLADTLCGLRTTDHN